ncbi:MAG: hypothetical protein JXA20_03640 [Spirochaetes bacterium]|nr:hypothetical protein [Spirochaetota bacterium]
MGVYVFCAVFVGMGLYSLAMGIMERLSWRTLQRRGMRVRGIARALSDGNNGITLSVTFVDEGVTSIRVASRGGDSGWSALDGRLVDALDERGRPETARIVADIK